MRLTKYLAKNKDLVILIFTPTYGFPKLKSNICLIPFIHIIPPIFTSPKPNPKSVKVPLFNCLEIKKEGGFFLRCCDCEILGVLCLLYVGLYLRFLTSLKSANKVFNLLCFPSFRHQIYMYIN